MHAHGRLRRAHGVGSLGARGRRGAMARRAGVGARALRRDARLAGRLTAPETESAQYAAAVTERMRRVNESVRAVVAEAVGDLKDPRIGLVTVTGVAVTP